MWTFKLISYRETRRPQKLRFGELAPVLMQRSGAACAKALDRLKDSGIILGGESRQTGSVDAVLRRSRPAETLMYRW